MDSFTNRYQPLKDSSVTINEKTNLLFQKVLSRANKGSQGCQEKKFYKSLRKSLRIHLWGEFIFWLWKTLKVKRINTKADQGIYQDFWKYQLLTPFASPLWRPLTSLVNVNSHLVGVDKFEHFLGSGYRYFKAHLLKKKGLDAALNIGFFAENEFIGAGAGGVKSFADLAANFNGMRFWNHLLQKDDDILGRSYNIGPYVECQNEQWMQVKKVDWRSYIDASFLKIFDTIGSDSVRQVVDN